MDARATIDFNEFHLLLRLPPLDGTGWDAFRVPPGEDGSSEFFIPPRMIHVDSGDPEVMLVSARGAAGKSTTARELARRCRVPLWRLDADRAVGGTSLEFALSQYFGTHNVEEYLKQNDSSALIIDSLDEARMRVSGVSWSEFLGSIARLASQGLRPILFGRERTLEDTWVAMASLGISVDWWEISHFAPDQSRNYVDAMVAMRDPHVDHRSTLYQDARDSIIESLEQSVSNDDAEPFVGYAPVLDAVAAWLIDKPNFLAIKNRFEDVSSATVDRNRTLIGVLLGLLQRDQTKVLSLAEDLGLEPAAIYTPDEQIAWLCHTLEGAPAPLLSNIEPPSKRAEYTERIAEFLADHPYRSDRKWASPVFESYVASTVFDSRVFSGERLMKIGNSSGLLFDFISDREDLIIDEYQFAALHSSVLASEWAETTASVDVGNPDRSATDGVGYTGHFALRREGQTAKSTSFLLIPSNDQTLTLHGPLSDLSVSVECEVRVPASEHGSVVGPDLYLLASRINFESQAIEFVRRATTDTNRGEASVVLSAQQVSLPPIISVPPLDGNFELHIPDSLTIGYPWQAYRSPLEDPMAPPHDRAVRFLNKLMNLSRSHGHGGERGVFLRKFAGRQNLPTEKFYSALAVLESFGVVRIESEMVFVREDWEQYRFSGKALKGQRRLDDVIEQWRPVLDAIEKAI